jgi:unsaturated rhamnogalacturonyl hydrolase
LNYVKPYVDKYVLADGTIQYFMADGVSVRDKRIQDVIQPSTLLFALYKNYPNSTQYLTAMKNTRNIFPTIQTNSLGGFFHKPTYQFQMWLDGLYMAEPFIVRFGDRYADKFDATGADKRACYNTATAQIKLIASKTMDLTQTDAVKKLPVHGWLDWAGFNAYNTANPTTLLTAPVWADKTTGKSPEKWGRALGWYTMALVDVLEFLPRDHADYQALKTILQTVAAGLKASQDPTTGLWYQVVDKVPQTNGTYSDNWIETSGSAMFVYALKKASTKGYISSDYATVASKGWTGIKTKVVISSGVVTVKGTVGGMSVCDSYAAYIAKSSIVADNVPHGIAAVLMAASVMEY